MFSFFSVAPITVWFHHPNVTMLLFTADFCTSLLCNVSISCAADIDESMQKLALFGSNIPAEIPIHIQTVIKFHIFWLYCWCCYNIGNILREIPKQSIPWFRKCLKRYFQLSCFHNDSIVYNELSMRMELSKKHLLIETNEYAWSWLYTINITHFFPHFDVWNV